MRHQLLRLSAGIFVGCATSAQPAPPAAGGARPTVVDVRPSSPPEAASISPPSAPAARIPIEVTDKGFVPSSVTVTHGRPVTFVFRRTTKRKCLDEVIIYLTDTVQMRQPLPFGEPSEFTLTFAEPGERGLLCGMRMYGATIHVR